MTWYQVNGYPADKLKEALDGVKVVVVPTGVPHKVRFHRSVKCVQEFTPSFSLARRKFPPAPSKTDFSTSLTLHDR